MLVYENGIIGGIKKEMKHYTEANNKYINCSDHPHFKENFKLVSVVNWMLIQKQYKKLVLLEIW